MTPLSSGWAAAYEQYNDTYVITSPAGDAVSVSKSSIGTAVNRGAANEILRQFAQDLLHCSNPRIKFGVTYMHESKGMCRLIGPDPEDGALLIMERTGDDSVLGEYFACEHSNLFSMGEVMK